MSEIAKAFNNIFMTFQSHNIKNKSIELIEECQTLCVFFALNILRFLLFI